MMCVGMLLEYMYMYDYFDLRIYGLYSLRLSVKVSW
jgi:hypothetical protein